MDGVGNLNKLCQFQGLCSRTGVYSKRFQLHAIYNLFQIIAQGFAALGEGGLHKYA